MSFSVFIVFFSFNYIVYVNFSVIVFNNCKRKRKTEKINNKDVGESLINVFVHFIVPVFSMRI